MKICLIVMLIFSVASLSSCTEEKVVEKVDYFEPPFTSQLINWSAMNNSGWKNMSFPSWFSKALIDSNNIKQIKIGFTNFNFTDSIVSFTDTMPHKIVDIIFDDKGSVKKVTMSEFIDGIQLAQHIFSYNVSADSLGYSTPAVSSNVKYREKGVLSLLNTMQELQQYQRLVLQASENKLLTYVDKSIKNEVYHYFILDSTNWNVSYIDHEFKSDGKNIFYYGSPTNYTSSFTLRNLVEKSMKQKRFYYPSKVLKSQHFYTKDFITKRWYNYNENGLLTGVNDSLVTAGNEFLHNELGVVKYDNNLAKEINFYSAEDTLKKVPVKRVSFTYTIKK